MQIRSAKVMDDDRQSPDVFGGRRRKNQPFMAEGLEFSDNDLL
jgi:hypothetical protein